MKKRSTEIAALFLATVLGSLSALGQPASPSTQIVFSSDYWGPKNIHIMNNDGSNVRRLEMDPGEQINPACSPDGNRIACL
jgi:hypothetical protein